MSLCVSEQVQSHFFLADQSIESIPPNSSLQAEWLSYDTADMQSVVPQELALPNRFFPQAWRLFLDSSFAEARPKLRNSENLARLREMFKLPSCAPEVKAHLNFTKASDVFRCALFPDPLHIACLTARSYGCFLWELSHNDSLERDMSPDLVKECNSSCHHSLQVKQLIIICCAEDPRERPSASKVLGRILLLTKDDFTRHAN